MSRTPNYRRHDDHPMDAFDAAWERLAEDGYCDALGGAEYRRVRAVWDALDVPPGIAIDLDELISYQANLGPYPIGDAE